MGRFLQLLHLPFKLFSYRESVAGSVIQATGTVEFEDGLWIGNHLKVLSHSRTCLMVSCCVENCNFADSSFATFDVKERDFLYVHIHTNKILSVEL